MKKLCIVAILFVVSATLTGCASVGATMRGALHGAGTGAIIGAAVGAVTATDAEIYAPVMFPYSYIDYGEYANSRYAVRYPSCRFIPPTPVYYPDGTILWMTPPTDPRCYMRTPR